MSVSKNLCSLLPFDKKLDMFKMDNCTTVCLKKTSRIFLNVTWKPIIRFW